jgi:methionyl-tRNA formyltransferase
LYSSVLRAGKPALLKIWSASAASAEAGSPGEILRSGRDGILVRCGEGGLLVTELQIEGGRRLAAMDFLAGHPLPAGSRLG